LPLIGDLFGNWVSAKEGVLGNSKSIRAKRKPGKQVLAFKARSYL
jgi:hypothetical protein